MLKRTVFNHPLEGQISSVHAHEARLHLSEDALPVPVLQVFAAQRLDKLRVVHDILHLLGEGHQNIVFLILLHLHLHLDVLSLVAVHLLHDLFSVLLLEVLHIPLLVLLGEGVTIVPEREALLILSLEDLDLGDACVFDVQHLLVLLILFNLVMVLIELLADLRELLEGLAAVDLGLSQHLAVKAVDLLDDCRLLLLNL